jgi:RNA polymerase sigma factor (sigma-70 family)
MDLKEKTDEELISQILDTKSTDRRLCQEELYDRYINKIYGKCLLLCKDPEAAKDVTQDVFIIVFTKLNTFRADSPFFGWIYKIAYNESLKYLNKNKKLIRSDEDFDQFENLPEPEKPEISNEERYTKLNQAFEKLTDINRAVMLLKYKEGKSILEITEMLEIGESAVKMRIKRSKLFIQKILTSN